MTVPTFGGFVYDCPDPAALAEFYRALLDWGPAKSEYDGHWVSLTNPRGGPRFEFQRVDDYRAPDWPSAGRPQQAHLDLDVPDIDAAHDRVLALGAKLLDDSPKSFRVYVDPVGHPFCLCACATTTA
jgi:predicted enzyme related to lactoylglutathione lyase